MTPEKLTRLAHLQRIWATGGLVAGPQKEEFDALCRELAASPEVADNPATPFTDESRRPLIGGGDSLATYQQRSCDEAKQFALLLAARFGEAFAKAALQAAAAGLKG